MENPVLNDIKRYVVAQLKARYGYCGVAESDTKAMINSDDKDKHNIKITLELTNKG